MKLRVLTCALVLLACALPALLAGPVVDQVVSPSVVVDDGTGTGTVIRCKGEVLVLTAAHVVARQATPRATVRITGGGMIVLGLDTTPLPVAIESKKGRTHSHQLTRIVWYDEEADLALLQPADASVLSPAHLPAKDPDPEPGDPVWYCGTGGGTKWNLVKSIVNQVDDDWLMLNGEAWYGHSGSGVFLEREGKLVLAGVIVRRANGSPNTPVLAVPWPKVRAFLDAYPGAKK